MALSIENLSKTYGDKTVLGGLSLRVEDGSVLAVLGESGAGKTTLLNILAGLTPSDAGKMTGLPEKVSYVFQDDRLIRHMTVKENLAFVLGGAATEEEIVNALSRANLSEAADQYPKELSKGMAKRVCLLRAYLYGADLMLLDEPFSNLDIATKLKMQAFFSELHREAPFTAILITHDVDEAVSLADRVVVLRGGRIAADLCVDDKNKEKTTETLKKILLKTE